MLIKRPETMSSHRGEIAFPGGKFEAGVDADLRATALREAHEEVGLDPGDVEIVARLDGIGTVATRFTITPFVGLPAAASRCSTPSPREVVRILEVPLSELLDPDAYREERWDTHDVRASTCTSTTSRTRRSGARPRASSPSFLAHLVAGALTAGRTLVDVCGRVVSARSSVAARQRRVASTCPARRVLFVAACSPAGSSRAADGADRADRPRASTTTTQPTAIGLRSNADEQAELVPDKPLTPARAP